MIELIIVMNILVRIHKKNNICDGNREGYSLTKVFKKDNILSFIFYVCSILVFKYRF